MAMAMAMARSAILVGRVPCAPRRPPRRQLACAASTAPGGGVGSEEEKLQRLVLYSKPGCCLCDGLKEKLDAAFSLAGAHSLHFLRLQVRDITTNPDWERRFQHEIPVLAKLLPDGTEEVLPRLSPRLGVELIQKKIHAAFDR